MTLPPLPLTILGQSVHTPLAVPVHHPLYTADQMREYGALCRKQALEEAAKACEKLSEAYMYPSLGNAVSHLCAREIRELTK